MWHHLLINAALAVNEILSSSSAKIDGSFIKKLEQVFAKWTRCGPDLDMRGDRKEALAFLLNGIRDFLSYCVQFIEDRLSLLEIGTSKAGTREFALSNLNTWMALLMSFLVASLVFLALFRVWSASVKIMLSLGKLVLTSTAIACLTFSIFLIINNEHLPIKC